MRSRSALVLGLALLASAGPPARGLAEPAARHAVVVVIDGARYSETFGDPLFARVPREALDLAPLGCVAPDMRNLGLTLTVPGMSSIACGAWQAIANDGSERPHVPTVLESWRIATGAPAADAWIVATKSKLSVLARSDHPASGPGTAASFELAANDSAVAARGIELLHGQHPSLLLLHLGDTDGAGHAGDWTSYTASIRRADSLVFALWQEILADDGLAASTAMFVTNDHGRHLDSAGGFPDHGDDCEGCRHVMLLALGAGLRHGVAASGHFRQIDLAPTLGALLGFATPWAQGAVMRELLLDPGGEASVGPAPGARLSLALASRHPAAGPVRFVLESDRETLARLEVFDAQGRCVARPFLGPLVRGRFTFEWDGRGSDGGALPAGVYLVRADDGRSTAALTLTRWK